MRLVDRAFFLVCACYLRRLSPCLDSRADSQGHFACPVPPFLNPVTYTFDYSQGDHEPFVHLQEETHIIVVKQVEQLNKQQDLARVKGRPLYWA